MRVKIQGLSKIRISVLGLMALVGVSANAATERVPVEAKMEKKKVAVKLAFNKNQSDNPEIFTITKLRAEFEGQTYPLLSSLSGGSMDWCNVLGFEHLSFSVVGSSSFEFDSEEMGLEYRADTKDFLLTKFSRNTKNVVDFILCTHNPDLSY